MTTNINEISKNKVNLTWFLIAIIAIIILNLVILILCRACSQRDMNNSVKVAISEYMSLRKANAHQQMSDDADSKSNQ